MTAAESALAIGAGALVCVERKALAQLMLARPIVVAPLIAALLGDARNGLYVGIPLELFFLGSASYGAATPPHETLAALFAGALAATAGPGLAPPYALAVAAFVALPLAAIGRTAETALERWNVNLVDRAQLFVAEGRSGRASRQALLAIGGTALLGATVTALGTLVGPVLGHLETALRPAAVRGLSLAWFLFVGASAAFALRAIETPGGALLSGIAAVTVFAVFGLTLLF